MLSDAELIKNYKAGNEGAFEVLLSRYKLPLFNYILRMVRSKDVAEDIFQDVWIRIIKLLPKYKEQNKFSGLLFKLANSKSIDYLRRNKRNLQVKGTLESRSYRNVEKDIEKRELLSLLNSAVMELPAKQKEIFLLREHTGLNFREISKMLDCPLNTVLARMRNAIISLRRVLKEGK